MPERRDAKLLQVLVRQARQNRLVYVILAECCLILPEAQAPQPDHDVHDGAPIQGCCTSSCGPGGVSRRPETAADRQLSVSIGAAIKAVAGSIPVPISVGGKRKISVSDQRA